LDTKTASCICGALLYSKYNWWQTLIIQLIMKITGGSTDKAQDIETPINYNYRWLNEQVMAILNSFMKVLACVI